MANKKIPLRRCVGCGEMKAKKELVRVVKLEDEIVLDATGRKNGRGAYLCANAKCLEKAKKSRGLERSFKAPVSEDVYRELEKEMNTFAEG